MDKIFIAVNGDDVGKGIGNAIASDDHEELGRLTQSVNDSHSMIEDWVANMGGRTITSSGDEGIYEIPQEAIGELDSIRAQYAEMSGNTLTIGVGHSMSEASKALIYGKLNEKDQIIQYEPQIDDYLSDGGYEEDEMEGEEDAAAELPDPETIEDESLEEDLAQEGEEGMEAPEDFEGQEDDAEAAFEEDAAPEQFEGEEDTTPEHEEEMSAEEDFAHDAMENQEDEQDGDIVEADEEIEMQDEIPSDEEAAAQVAEDEGINGMTDEEEGDYPEPAPEEEAIGDELTEEAEPDMGEEEMPEEEYEELGPEDIVGEGGGEAPAGDEESMLTDMIHGQLNGEEDMEGADQDQLRDEIAEALIAFKAHKDQLEEARETNPQLYEATITMLRSMIEMAKQLGMSPEQEMEEREAAEELQEEFPEEMGDYDTEDVAPEEGEEDEEAQFAAKK